MTKKAYGKVKIKKIKPVLADIPEDCGYEKQFEHNIDMNSNLHLLRSAAEFDGIQKTYILSAFSQNSYRRSGFILTTLGPGRHNVWRAPPY